MAVHKLNQFENTDIGGIISFPIVISFIIFLVWVKVVKMEFVGGVLIGIILTQLVPAWKYFFAKNQVNPRIFVYPNKQIFNAGIINNKRRYPEGSTNINFISEFSGKLKNGYFINEIIFAENADSNKFPPNLPYVNEDFSSIRLPCHDTIDNIDGKKGKLNGCREYHLTWALDMDFQNGLPRGKYKVKCMVFNENDIESLLPPKESIFEVIESSDPNKPFNSHVNPSFK